MADFGSLVDNLLQGGFGIKVLTMETHGQQTGMRKHPDYSPLHALAREPGLFHVVGMKSRPGVRLFAASLEHRYFPPGSRRNDDYRLCYVAWSELSWVVVTIPAKSRRFAERTAERSRLRLADGIPTALVVEEGVIAREQTTHFPLNGPNVFTLEFAKGFDYAKAREPGAVSQLFRQETEELSAMMHELSKSTPERN